MAKDSSHRNHLREQVAQLAARLIAEDGIQDYAQAKRKAARQLRAEDSLCLPNNAEIENALKTYHAIYHPASQKDWVSRMRRHALDTMRLLERFNPHLAGSVLSGTAAAHSDINLLLFSDSAKEVELYLLGKQIPYRVGVKRLKFGDEARMVPTVILEGELGMATVEAAILSEAEFRQGPRSPINGRPMAKANSTQLETLIEAD